MIVLRATMKPKFGKTNQLADFIKEWVDYRGGLGERAAGSRRILSSDGPEFSAVTFHESVGAMGAWRESVFQDRTYTDLVGRSDDRVDGQVALEIHDVVVATQTTGISPIAERVSSTPILGKTAELKAALTDWVRNVESSGGGISLLQQIFGLDGPVLATRQAFESLAELEEERNRSMATLEFAEFLSKFTQSAAGFPSWEIQENVASANF